MIPGGAGPALRLTLYTRRDCHLCLQAHELLARLQGEGASFSLEEIDVDGSPALRDRFGLEVPVLCAGERRIAKGRFDEGRLRRRFGIPARPPQRSTTL